MFRRLILLISVLLLAGCAGEPKDRPLVVWHWMTDRHQVFEELATRYKEQTGVTVEFKKFFPPDIYSTKVIAAARAGTLPDVFGILGEKKILASFVKAGHVVDFADALSQDGWKERFYPQALAVTQFPAENFYAVSEGYYGIPIDSMNMQFVYNKKLLRDAGLDENNPPRTFTDFIAFAKKIKDAGKQAGMDTEGFVCGWGEVWLMHCLATEWAINLMGEEKFVNTLKGDVPYTDPQWIQVFSLFKQLKDEGVLYSDIVTMVNREAEDYFARGRAAFAFDGSWSINVYNQLAPDLDYGFFPIPAVAEGKPAPVWGGSGASFMVSSASSKKDEAIAFLKWLTEPEQQMFLVEKTNNLPAITGLEASLGEKLTMLLDDMDATTHPNVWPYEEDSRVIEVMDKGLQQIVLGEKTPEEVAQKIENMKSRLSSQ